jgi:threonine dehydratase
MTPVAKTETAHSVTFDDVLAAREFIAPYLPKTPLVRSEKLSALLDCDYYLKCENVQPIGAFKVRGGVNLVGTDDSVRTACGSGRAPVLVTASTGNHGQSIAYAGRLFGVPVIIYAPAENVNETKMQAMRALGADVRLHGRDFDEARSETERMAESEGYRYVHSANEPKLIAGVGTIGLEIFEDLPDVDLIIAPAGGGSCASGNCIVAKHLKPNVEVMAVQSEAAPAMWHAWKNRSLDEYPTMKTEHEGLATRVPFEMPSRILWDLLDDFLLVTDDDINEAIRLLAVNAKQIAEGAGAASLACALKLRDQEGGSSPTLREGLKGKKVVGILTGGNIPPQRFASLMKSAAPA